MNMRDFFMAKRFGGGSGGSGDSGDSGGGMVGGVVTVEADTDVLKIPADLTGTETIIIRYIDRNAKSSSLTLAFSTKSCGSNGYRDTALTYTEDSTGKAKKAFHELTSGNMTNGYVYFEYGYIWVTVGKTIFMAGQKYEWVAFPDDWQ